VLSRRDFLKFSIASVGGLIVISSCAPQVTLLEKQPGSDNDISDAKPERKLLEPENISKYVTPLFIPPVMPQSTAPSADLDYYEITMRQFKQQVLPDGSPATTVWGYGSANHPETFHYPAPTIEAKTNRPVRVKWINGLMDDAGNYLPHPLPVDQTLHWANPGGGTTERDGHGHTQQPYTGPVPIVTHVHGAHVTEESDGYPEAWYLPAAKNIPAGYAASGSWYDKFKQKFKDKYGVEWEQGTCTFQYPNQQRAATLWFHDHTLGMTRVNVYIGPAGFYLLRGGEDDQVSGLPGPAPVVGDADGTKYYEIPLAIQDRQFNDDGSFFYPDNRAFFEGVPLDKLKIPFHPDAVTYPDGSTTGESDIAPIWNPEYFGNVMLVNGRTWPVLEVEPRRYRFRVLNACGSRTLILKLGQGDPLTKPALSALPFWQIGSEGGFLPQALKRETLLMGPAERDDIIIDFSGLPAGKEIYLTNEAPDEPYGGGKPGDDYEPADPKSTGQVMKFIVGKLSGTDQSLPPEKLALPAIKPLGPAVKTRQVSLNEAMSMTLLTSDKNDDKTIQPDPKGEPFGPAAAYLGTVLPDGSGYMQMWKNEVTENPTQGAVEIWEIHNFTEDGHPIHIHQVMFQVVERQPREGGGAARPPEAWETGWKDTVIAYPKEITRVRLKFELPGRYVWHCHILEHEDNEMMRPLDVLPAAT
jgi:bilirubin oxidase